MDFAQYIPNTQEMHAITSHLPVAMSIVGVVAVLAAILIKTQRDVLRWSAAACYGLLAVTAYIAEETGENARTALSGSLPKSIWEIVEEHQDMADKVLYLGLATAVLMIISIVSKGALRRGASALTIGASLGTAVWVGLTGHHGGTLVYEHGIGIPPDQVVEWRINPPADPGPTAIATVDPKDLIPIFPIDPEEAEKISWVRDILPLFEEVCNECHRPGDLDAELDMTTVEGLLKGGEKYGSSLIPGKPDESTLVKYSRGELQPQMPEDDMPLLKEELHILRLWIYAGAKDDSGGPSE